MPQSKVKVKYKSVQQMKILIRRRRRRKSYILFLYSILHYKRVMNQKQTKHMRQTRVIKVDEKGPLQDKRTLPTITSRFSRLLLPLCFCLLFSRTSTIGHDAMHPPFPSFQPSPPPISHRSKGIPPPTDQPKKTRSNMFTIRPTQGKLYSKCD